MGPKVCRGRRDDAYARAVPAPYAGLEARQQKEGGTVTASYASMPTTDTEKLQIVTKLLTFSNQDKLARVHAHIDEARKVLGVYDYTPTEETYTAPRSWYECWFR